MEKSHVFRVELEHRVVGSSPARDRLSRNETDCRVCGKLVVWEVVVKLLAARLRVTRLEREDVSGTVLVRALLERSRNVRLRAIAELKKFKGRDATPWLCIVLGGRKLLKDIGSSWTDTHKFLRERPGIPSEIECPIFMLRMSTRVSSLDKQPLPVKRKLSSGPSAVLSSSRSRIDGGILGSDPDGNDPVPFTTKLKSPSRAIIPSADILSGTLGLVNALGIN
jgi:hypothetical protein